MVETAAYKVPGNWKLLWKLVVPPKFCSFMWRMVRYFVPIRVRLQDKGPHVPELCPWCGAGQETLPHLGMAELLNQSVKQYPCFRECVFQVLEQLPWHICCHDVELVEELEPDNLGK